MFKPLPSARSLRHSKRKLAVVAGLMLLSCGTSWAQSAVNTAPLLPEVDRVLLPQIVADGDHGIVQRVTLVETFSNGDERTISSTVWTKLVQDGGQVQQRWNLVRIDPQTGSSGALFLIRNNLSKGEQRTFLYRKGLVQPLLISASANAAGGLSIAQVAGLSFAGLYRITGEATVTLEAGKTALKLNLLALKGSVAFQRIDLFLEPVTFKPLFSILLSQNEVQLKQVNYRVFSTLGTDDSLATQIAIDDLAFEAVHTLQTISDTQVVPLPDELFEPDKLSDVEDALRELGF